MYDYLIVGAGLYGSICAYELNKKGYKVKVIEKRNHIGGNLYTEEIEGINVHVYGAHIFHTSNKKIWDYINQFATFNNFINAPIANYNNELYNLPFNMNTFTKLWSDVKTPNDAINKIEQEKQKYNIDIPKNLEEQAIKLVGSTIYEKLIKGYTYKQWGRDCKDLPSFIIKRLPVRFTFNNNYFNDTYQGIPIGGYTKVIEKLLVNIEVELNIDYLDNRDYYNSISNNVIYTGTIDSYYKYMYGYLEYRTIYFENEIIDIPNYQGTAVVNYTSKDIPYTRIIEHKHFEFDSLSPKTIISKEYSKPWTINEEPYYPLNDEKNNKLYEKYLEVAKSEKKVHFGGRLGEYKYYDMDKVIESALDYIDSI